MANEKRLIPLRKRIIYGGDVFNSLVSEKGWPATEAADFVKAFLTVDAVEVVRCKDCKHYIEDTSMSPDFIASYCDYHGKDYSFMAHDFCSNGERRKENA